jgi:hypothetical protein
VKLVSTDGRGTPLSEDVLILGASNDDRANASAETNAADRGEGG